MTQSISEEQVNALTRNEDLCIRASQLKDIHAQVEANILDSQEKVRKRKMSKGEEDNFEVGDRVLRKNIRQEQRKGGKMEPDLLGPFAIVNIEGKSADLLQCNGRTIEKINIDHLKRYVEPQPRIPAKWIALSPLIPHAQQTSSCLSPAVPQSHSETISLQSPINSLSETVSLQSPIKSPNDSLCQHSPMVPQHLSETPSPQSDPMSGDTASSRTIFSNIPEELMADIW
ncbi:uncharacterized protein LOC117814249 [Notolabrus celidotus]|uniref:uncharacterized protein LOC117814249 n=1 Tax=Notolabrus celidotus TaxID=1203425 RepID=UPI00148FDD07|nr:uncharacterized protein LOC117814249 [Notolabrus celidotus]